MPIYEVLTTGMGDLPPDRLVGYVQARDEAEALARVEKQVGRSPHHPHHWRFCVREEA